MTYINVEDYYRCHIIYNNLRGARGKLIPYEIPLWAGYRTTGHWMATGKAWGLASSLWEALLAWGAGGGPVEATAPTASTATY